MNSLTVTPDCRRIAGSVPRGELPLRRDNDRSASMIPEFHMTASLANLYEANLSERSNGLLARHNG
jgi:hypothetical protein